MNNSVELITGLFLVVNTGRVLAYFPQIVSAIQCVNGARSVSCITWSYFSLAHITGAFYSFHVTQDKTMALVFLCNFLICVTLVAIVLWKRIHFIRPT